jgi:hypothetical protein
VRNSFIIAILLIFSSTGLSTNYLDATDNFPYTKIQGDGTEAGVLAEIEFTTRNENPVVSVEFKQDKFITICKDYSVELLSKVSNNDETFSFIYLVKVDTEVFADTGKCSIWINSDNHVYEIIDYSYAIIF